MCKYFIYVQVLSEVAVTPTLVEEESTSAFQTIQSTTSIRTVIKQVHTFMALSMKSARIIHLNIICMITTPHVPCVTSSHVELS